MLISKSKKKNSQRTSLYTVNIGTHFISLVFTVILSEWTLRWEGDGVRGGGGWVQWSSMDACQKVTATDGVNEYNCLAWGGSDVMNADSRSFVVYSGASYSKRDGSNLLYFRPLRFCNYCTVYSIHCQKLTSETFPYNFIPPYVTRQLPSFR